MLPLDYQATLMDALKDVCEMHKVGLVPLLISLLDPLGTLHTISAGFRMEDGALKTDIEYITQTCNGGKVPNSLADALRAFYAVHAAMNEHNADIYRKAAGKPNEPVPPNVLLAQASSMEVISRHQRALSELLTRAMKIWEQQGIDMSAGLDPPNDEPMPGDKPGR